MSIVELPGYCYCECHRSGSMLIHSVPCCAGKCEICKAYVTDEEHFEECRQRIEDLANGAEER